MVGSAAPGPLGTDGGGATAPPSPSSPGPASAFPHVPAGPPAPTPLGFPHGPSQGPGYPGTGGPAPSSGSAAQCPLRGLERAILGASHAWGTPLEMVLATKNDAPAAFDPALHAGAVISVDHATEQVWRMPAHIAAAHPLLGTHALIAAAHGTFCIHIRSPLAGTQPLPTGEGGVVVVAWGHSPYGRPPLSPTLEPPPTAADALPTAWGPAASATAIQWASRTARLLPPVLDRLARYRAVAKRVAEEEAAAGNASARSDKSLDMRASAYYLSVSLLDQLRSPSSAMGALPVGLHRRLVAKSTKSLLFPSSKPPKPHFWDLPAIVQKAGWRRVTRQTSGYPWPRHDPPAGTLRFLDPTALFDAYQQAVGVVPDDSVVWTICEELAGHTPALTPQLQGVIDAALAQGGPLLTFDLQRLEPMPPPDQAQAHWDELQKLVAQGTYVKLTPDQVKDPSLCKVVSWLGCVIKTTLSLDAAETAAVEAGDVPEMARLAQARASRLVAALQGALGPGSTHPHLVLEYLRTAEGGVSVKVRPVVRGGWGSKGDRRLGIAKAGIIPSGFQFPSLLEMVSYALSTHHILKLDFTSYFYTLKLSSAGSALSCVCTRDPQGQLHYYALQGASMGVGDSPALGECVSSLVCTIANARGCSTPANPVGACPMQDDLCLAAEPAHATVCEGILADLITEINGTEQAAKRVKGPTGEVLGKLFSLPDHTVSVPHSRLFKYLYTAAIAHQCLSHPSPGVQAAITGGFLSKTVGVLSWLTEVTLEGNLHLAGLYAATAVGKSVASCREEVLEDLEWWLKAAQQGRLTGTLRLSEHPSAKVEVAATDASDSAAGVIWRGKAIWKPFSKKMAAQASARRELHAFRVALQIIAPLAPGSTLAITSDSVGAVMALSKGRFRGKGFRTAKQRRAGKKDMRACYRIMRKHSVHAVAIYLPREFLQEADAASKHATEEEFRQWATTSGFTPLVATSSSTPATTL